MIKNERDIANAYDNGAEAFDLLKSEATFSACVESPFLHSLLQSGEGKNILDLGCGTGVDLFKLSKQNPSFLAGVDFSEGVLNIAKEKFKNLDSTKFTFEHADITIPTFYVGKTLQENFFDIVMSCWVVSHMGNFEQLENYFTNIYNLMKKGGMAEIFSGDYKVFYQNELGKSDGYEVFPDSKDWEDGMKIRSSHETIKFYDFYWNVDTLMEVMKKVGFINVERLHNNLVNENFKETCELYNKLDAYYIIKAFK
jgi:ubiquinone/menaquinone biosynthesis C-methylase UbiE